MVSYTDSLLRPSRIEGNEPLTSAQVPMAIVYNQYNVGLGCRSVTRDAEVAVKM